MTVVVQAPPPDVLIVDAEHMIHRAFHAYLELRTSTWIPSGVFYGFLSILHRQEQNLRPGTTVVVWGHPESGRKRKEAYPDYKAGRTPQPALYKQMHDVQRFLSALGWTQCYNDEGWEADDVIATLAHRYQRDYPDVRIVILSGDHDFLQLVNDGVSVLKPGNSKVPDKLFDVERTTALWGVPPDMLADLYAISGEKSDTVVGVPGFAEKSAAKLLVDNGPIRDWFGRMESVVTTPKKREVLVANKDRMALNKRLISLKNSDVDVREIPQTDSLGDAQLILEKYEIKKFTIEDFVAFFPKE